MQFHLKNQQKLSLRPAGRLLYGVFQKLIVPQLRHSQVIYAETLPRFVTPGTVWLELGCGHRILRGYQFELEKELVGRCQQVAGIDKDLEALKKHRTINCRTYGDLVDLPYADSSFDLVTANMVVEHLEDPGRVLCEVHRVLKPGGIFLFHTPNSRGYKVMLARFIPDRVKPTLVYLIEGRRDSDVFPTAYRMNSPESITPIANNTGFLVDKIRLIIHLGIMH